MPIIPSLNCKALLQIHEDRFKLFNRNHQNIKWKSTFDKRRKTKPKLETKCRSKLETNTNSPKLKSQRTMQGNQLKTGISTNYPILKSQRTFANTKRSTQNQSQLSQCQIAKHFYNCKCKEMNSKLERKTNYPSLKSQRSFANTQRSTQNQSQLSPSEIKKHFYKCKTMDSKLEINVNHPELKS